MAKKNEIVQQEPAGSLAVPEHLRGGAVIEGADQSLSLGRMSLYQGTPTEQEKYDGCGFKPGDFVDVLERRKMASSRIVCVAGFMTWQNWPKDFPKPVYTFRNRNEVPVEDLDWNGDQPPAATEVYNYIVLVDGEGWPYLLNFKRTAFKVGKDIAQLEARRSASGAGRGFYALASKVEKNANKQSYQAMTYQILGNCPETMYPLLTSCLKQIENVKKQAEEPGDPETPV